MPFAASVFEGSAARQFLLQGVSLKVVLRGDALGEPSLCIPAPISFPLRAKMVQIVG